MSEWVGGDFGRGACEAMVSGTQETCNVAGEQGCWDESSGKCCGDDDNADNWVDTDSTAECVNGQWELSECQDDSDCTNPNPTCQDVYCDTSIVPHRCQTDLYEPDANETVCTSCSTGEWINGMCCGDDSSEYSLSQSGEESSLENGYKSDSSDEACCDQSTDCVYNGACYNADSAPGVNVDGDSDYDYCGSAGGWWDCFGSASSLCSHTYGVCPVHDCEVDCFAKPCLDGQPTCYDYYKDQTLYCVTTDRDADKSNFVEDPNGNNLDEGYCPLGYYYEYGSFGGSCKSKGGVEYCYNTLAQSSCGIVNIPSMLLNCYSDSSDYCDLESGRTPSQIIPSTEEPKQTVNLGPEKTFHGVECIDTDGGVNTTAWGCTYIANSSVDGGETIIAQIACDDNNTANTIIEHYCDGDEIKAYQYDCDMIRSDASHVIPPVTHCFVKGTNLVDTTPQIKKYIHEHN
jgi:hypothetical protein